MSAKNDSNGRSEREIAREHLIRARLYGFISLSFVVVGFVVFFVFYDRYIGGDVLAFFKKPLLFVMMFLPFLPAYIFALLAVRRREAFLRLLYGEADGSGKGGAKKPHPGGKP